MKSCNKLKLTESAQPVHTTHLRTTKFNILACAPIYPLPRVFSGIKVVKTKLSECSPNNVHTLPIHILSNLILVVQTGSSFDAHDRELVRPPPLPPHTPTHPGRMGCYCMGYIQTCVQRDAGPQIDTNTHTRAHTQTCTPGGQVSAGSAPSQDMRPGAATPVILQWGMGV